MTKSKTAVKNADEFERLNSKRGEQMKYLGKPAGMWALFAGSFEKHLTVEFDLTAEQAKDVAARAKKKYREIIAKLPEFDKRDRFEMNIVNCAMLAAFILCMPQRPDIETLTDYYAAAMMTPTMKAFCRASGKKKFTPKDIEGMKATAKLRAGDRIDQNCTESSTDLGQCNNYILLPHKYQKAVYYSSNALDTLERCNCQFLSRMGGDGSIPQKNH